MRFTLVTLVCFASIFSKAQFPLLSAINDTTIVKNRVFKCIEYSKSDSAAFFEKYQNGYYGLYNMKGQLIEKNSYSSGSTIREFTIHYIYDEKGRNIMWIWHNPQYLNKISRVRIEHFDSLGVNYGYQDFSSNQNHASAYDIKYYEKLGVETFRDSLVSASKKSYFLFDDELRKDTLEARTFYYSENLLDSIVTEIDRPQIKNRSKKLFIYDAEGTLLKTEEKLFVDEELHTLERIVYSKEGLPQERWRKDYWIDGENLVHTGYEYLFYESEE